jgi:hypothetical protein
MLRLAIGVVLASALAAASSASKRVNLCNSERLRISGAVLLCTVWNEQERFRPRRSCVRVGCERLTVHARTRRSDGDADPMPWGTSTRSAPQICALSIDRL